RLRVAAVAAIRLPPCSHGADVRVGLSLIHILTVDETAVTVLPPDTGAQAPAETGHSGRARDDAVRVRPGLRAPGRGSSRRAGARKELGAHDGRPAAESRRSIPRIGRCTPVAAASRARCPPRRRARTRGGARRDHAPARSVPNRTAWPARTTSCAGIARRACPGQARARRAPRPRRGGAGRRRGAGRHRPAGTHPTGVRPPRTAPPPRAAAPALV